jgi:hypothetical protein
MNSKKLKLLRRRRSKLAVSEVMGVVIMLGVTISVGFAVWAWARSAATGSENSFGFYSIGTSVNTTNEKLAIVNANFSGTATQNVTVWFLNYGGSVAYVNQVWISNVTSITAEQWTNATQNICVSNAGTTLNCGSQTKLKVNCRSSTSCLSTGYFAQIPAGSIKMVTFRVNSPFKITVLYEFKVLTIYGNSYTYQQTR